MSSSSSDRPRSSKKLWYFAVAVPYPDFEIAAFAGAGFEQPFQQRDQGRIFVRGGIVGWRWRHVRLYSQVRDGKDNAKSILNRLAGAAGDA